MADAKRAGKPDLRALSRLFSVEASFLEACLHEGEEPDPRRLRRIQRLCAALEIEPDVAAMLAEMTDRIAELELLVRELGG